MTPEEKLHHHTKWMLDKIQYQYLLASNRMLSYNTGNVDYSDDKIPSIETRNKLMLKLEKLGVIAIQDEPEYRVGSGTTFNIEIVQPKFSQLYNLYENASGMVPTELSSIVSEWAHPISNNTTFQLKIWELTKPIQKKNNLSKVADSKADNFLVAKDLKPTAIIGDLAAYSDGTIRFKSKIIELRNQLKDLCRLFIRNPKRLITSDDIKEELISADKRKSVGRATIAKYVSELHSSLKIHFGKDVIFNQKEEGWHLDISK